ncbi:hypothetical protein ACFQ8S_36625 [Streptomyces virginiae]|uniref:hypothetical protein n=1 Tax=Streptomyces virginiae TaxID=1961 RepID=UPI0036B8E7CE
MRTPPGFHSRPDAASRYGLANRHREEPAASIARLNTLVEAHLRAARIGVPRQ